MPLHADLSKDTFRNVGGCIQGRQSVERGMHAPGQCHFTATRAATAYMAVDDGDRFFGKIAVYIRLDLIPNIGTGDTFRGFHSRKFLANEPAASDGHGADTL